MDGDQKLLAWVTSLRSKEAGRWITAVPKMPKYRFTSREFQTVVRFRLLLPIPQLERGISCTCKTRGENSFNRIDETGHHFISGCSKTGLRNELHNVMERELAYNFRYCGLSVITEELDCFKTTDSNSNKRPDLSIDNAQEVDSGEDRTRRLILDFSLTGPLPGSRGGVLKDPPSAGVQDIAADKAFAKKNTTYYDIADQNNLSFLPFIMETTGRMHPRAVTLLRSCAKLAEESLKIPKATLYGYMIKNISCVLQKRIAQVIIRRITGIHGRQSDAERNSYHSSHDFVSTSHHYVGERSRF